jgi:ribonuclease HI
VEYLDERDINVYTDGSMLPAPRRGGLGIVFVTEGTDGEWQTAEFPVPGYKSATNNQMERRAVIEALEALARGFAPVGVGGYRGVVVRTDSQWLVDGYHRARFTWPANRWLTRDGNPVVDKEEWLTLLKTVDRLAIPVKIEWVKGHRTSLHNRRADKLAKSSAKGHLRSFPVERKVRRKESPHRVQRGSVGMKGQRLTIRIIEEAPPAGGLARFKYEVMSKKSPYYQHVDYIWDDSASPMRAGHTYRVRVNEDTRSPANRQGIPRGPTP